QRLAKAGLIPKMYIERCPFCNKNTPETIEHMLIECFRWNSIRHETTIFNIPRLYRTVTIDQSTNNQALNQGRNIMVGKLLGGESKETRSLLAQSRDRYSPYMKELETGRFMNGIRVTISGSNNETSNSNNTNGEIGSKIQPDGFVDETEIKLSQDQRDRLAKARKYLFELNESKFKISQTITEAALPPGIVNPGLIAGMDPRNLAVLARIYVGSIFFEITEDQIRKVFSEFGFVKHIAMSSDPATGKHKGFGFVEFDVPESAYLALETMDGTMLGGRQLKVGRPTNYSQALSSITIAPPPERIFVANINEAVSESDLTSIFESFGKVKQCVLAPNMLTRQHKGVGMSALENLPVPVIPDVLVSTEKQSAEGAHNLKQEMSPEKGGNGLASNKATDGLVRVVAQTEPTEIVCLANVVDIDELDEDLSQDIYEESKKAGKVKNIVITTDNNEVQILIEFSEISSSKSAINLFNNRWFGGKQIKAEFCDRKTFEYAIKHSNNIFVPPS
ncbi:hypothetical protein BB560_005493, partial [Smittium megazygosporum]